MKESILVSFILVLLLITACTHPSQEDKLATQLSQSKNFIQLELISKKMMDQVNLIKKDPELSNTFKNLDSLSRRDSILQYLLRSENFSQISRQMAEAAKNMNQEFPELNKMSREEKRKVWKKAAALVMANQNKR